MDENLTSNSDEKKKKLLETSHSFFYELKSFFHDILNFKDGTDIEGTIQGIKKDIVFKGHNVWILIASIFIASIGLNQNSIPVIIGAMLISPLMGPILGVGLAVGTNDWQTLKTSLKYFAIAVIVSIITSTIYFLISPLKDAQSELLARTQPTLLDVFLGIFGGFAGIVAGSRREKSNVVPGVAIATALMPPLCTAGYGLATLQLSFFLGAFYLFFINSIFISLSTFLIVRYLHFPLMNFVSKEREKKIKLYMLIFIIIIILPSAFLFFSVIQESRFNYRSQQFITDNFKDSKKNILYTNVIYSDTLSEINIYIADNAYTDAQILDLNDKLVEYGLAGKNPYGIKVTDSTVLYIHQNSASIDDLSLALNDISTQLNRNIREGILEDLYKKQDAIINNKNERIQFLEDEIVEFKKDSIPNIQLRNELKIQYPEIKKFAISKVVETSSDSGQTDTLHVFLVNWNNKMSYYSRKVQENKLEKWLKVRFNLDTLKLVRYNL